MTRGGSVVLLLCLAACGGEPPDPPDPGPVKPEPPPLADVGEPTLPEVDLVALPPPDAPRAHRWKLPVGAQHRYELLQTTYLRDGERQQRADSYGRAVLQSDRPGSAAIRFSIAPAGTPPLDREKWKRFDYRIAEDGEIYPITDDTAIQFVLLDTLFSVPAEPMRAGDAVETKIAYRGGGKFLSQNGTKRTTLTGYVKVGPRPCARFVSEMDIDMTPAKITAVEGSGKSRWKVAAYFDYEEGCLVRLDARGFVAQSLVVTLQAPGGITYGTQQVFMDTELRIRKK